MNKKACLFFLVMAFSAQFNHVFAQQNPYGAFKMFYEKVYLHLDRTYYASGDNIWFNAYLVNAQNNNSINTSNNLYVELITPDSKVMKKELIRLDNGLGKGDFKLGDSIPSGNYRIRAYTNWIRNFGNNFIFEKEIQVQSIADKPKTIKPETPLYTIQFFAEGGYLVQDIEGKVAFKAEDKNGNGIDVKGAIFSDKGDTVARFKSSHLGMGTFTFKPNAGNTYKAIVQYKNLPATTVDFLTFLTEGYVLNITQADTAIILNIGSNMATVAKHPTGQVMITGRYASKLYYKEKIALQNGNATVTISKKTFPNGIADIRLYDETQHPYCERLVFIDGNNPVNIAVTTNKTVYGPKEKMSVTVTATDAQNLPVKAALSLAAVDEGIVPVSSTNIASYLFLESELKGKIQNASMYFDTKNANRLQQLDVLLLTQGWRSFLWQTIAETPAHISFLPEPGITISGRVRELLVNKPLANMNVTLTASGARGDKIYFTKTDSMGRYFLDGLPLYGSNQSIRINSKNNKGKKGGMIILDSIFSNPLAITPLVYHNIDTSAKAKTFATEAIKRSAAMTANSNANMLLPEVTVTASNQQVLTSRDGGADMTYGKQVRHTVSPADYTFETLANYMIKNEPGAVADVENDKVNFIVQGKPVSPRFYIDNQEDVFERLDFWNLPMQDIVSYTIDRLVGSRDGSTMTDRIAIRLTLKPGASNHNDLSLINQEIDGYYEARTFYTPTYLLTSERAKTDVRTTIHWEPKLVTGSDGKVTIYYYNADPKTTIRITVEGIANNNTPVVATTKYEVK